MSARAIPASAIFVERDGWVSYVTNWQQRFSEPARPRLVRLSPRHFVRYHELKAKGRGPKTIALLLFKKVPRAGAAAPAPTPQARAGEGRTVSVDIAMLTHEQVLALLQRDLGARFPGLRTLALTEIRRLYLAVQGLRAGE